MEHPGLKSKDIVAATRFLANRDEINLDRVSGLSICASSGYMVKAFVDSDNLKTVAFAAARLHNPKIAAEVYGGQETVSELIATGRAEKARFAETDQRASPLHAQAKLMHFSEGESCQRQTARDHCNSDFETKRLGNQVRHWCDLPID